MEITTTVVSYEADEYIEITKQQTMSILLKVKDVNGNLYTPTALRWQLTDFDNNIINGRSFEVPQDVVDRIVLNYIDTSGADNEDTLFLYVAIGLTLNNTNYQENIRVKIKVKDNNLTYPNLFGTVPQTGMDEPYTQTELDVPFDNLDSPF